MEFLARDVSWGFVVKGPAVPSGGQWEIVVAPELAVASMQFCRVVLATEPRAAGADRNVFIVFRSVAEGRENDLLVARSALENESSGSAVVFARRSHSAEPLQEHGVGRIEIDAGCVPISAGGVAAAAISAYNGTLADLEAVHVQTPDAEYRVGISFTQGMWRAVSTVAG